MVELRTRPATINTGPPTSLRHGLRNSETHAYDDLYELPPQRRQKHFKNSGDRSLHLDSAVHVSSVRPELVIAGIQPHQWPPDLQPVTAPPTPKRQKRSPRVFKAPPESPPKTRRSSRFSTGSRSPLKTRAASAESLIHSIITANDQEPNRSLVESPEKANFSKPTTPSIHDSQDLSHQLIEKASTSKVASNDGNTNEGDSLAQQPTEPPSHHQNTQESTTAEAGESQNEPLLSPTAQSRAASSIPSPPASPQPANGASQRSSRPPASADPDHLTEADFPSPFLQRPPTPEHFADQAARLHHKRYLPLPPLSDFTRPLTEHDPSTRSTNTLLKLAKSTFKALVAWQDEYLSLDKKTAPAQNPPKRPANGGRVPLEPSVFEAQKEIDLWGHVLGVEGREYSRSLTQRPGYAGLGLGNGRPGGPPPSVENEGKRARRRGADAKLIDGVAAATSETEAAALEKRTRKPVRRFDAGSNGITGRKRRRRGGFRGFDDRHEPSEYENENTVTDNAGPDDADGDERPTKRGRIDDVYWRNRRHADVEPVSANIRPRNESIMSEDVRGLSTTPTPSTRGGRGRGRGRGGRGRGARTAVIATTQIDQSQETPVLKKDTLSTEPPALQSQPEPRNETTQLPAPPKDTTSPYSYPAHLVPPPNSAHPPQPVQPPTVQAVLQNHPSANPTNYPPAALSTQPSSNSTASTPTIPNQTPTVVSSVPETTSTRSQSHKQSKPKSEKRSSSMTAWWAERKRKAAEEKMRLMREKGVPFVDGSAGFAASPGSGSTSGVPSNNTAVTASNPQGPPPVLVPPGYPPPPSDSKGMWVPIQYGPPPPPPPTHHHQHAPPSGPPPPPSTVPSKTPSRPSSGQQKALGPHEAPTHTSSPSATQPHPHHLHGPPPPLPAQASHTSAPGPWNYNWHPENRYPPPPPPPQSQPPAPVYQHTSAYPDGTYPTFSRADRPPPPPPQPPPPPASGQHPPSAQHGGLPPSQMPGPGMPLLPPNQGPVYYPTNHHGFGIMNGMKR